MFKNTMEKIKKGKERVSSWYGKWLQMYYGGRHPWVGGICTKSWESEKAVPSQEMASRQRNWQMQMPWETKVPGGFKKEARSVRLEGSRKWDQRSQGEWKGVRCKGPLGHCTDGHLLWESSEHFEQRSDTIWHDFKRWLVRRSGRKGRSRETS